MLKNRKTDLRKEQLADALDGRLGESQQKALLEKVRTEDPELYETYHWMLKQRQEQGVFSYLSEWHESPVPDDAIRKFHERREAEVPAGSDLETLVRSLFRRYVVTTGAAMMLLFATLQWAGPSEQPVLFTDADPFLLQVEIAEIQDSSHWLYEDL